MTLLMALLACTPEECAEGYGRNQDGSCVPLDAGEPGTGDDTSGPTADDTAPPDSAGWDTAPPEGVTVERSGPIACDDPSARQAQPLVAADLGDDWADQHATGEQSEKLGGGVSVIDVTGDGLLDVLIPQIGDDQLYVAQSNGTLVDEAATRFPAGLTSNSSAISAADVDGDGDVDLFVCNLDGDNTLLLNDGTGVFTDGTEAAGLAGQHHPTLSAGWGDMDGDGDLDLFVANYRNCGIESDKEAAADPMALWENQGDGTFVDVSDRLDHTQISEAIMRIGAWLDVDRDGDQDLYLVNDALDQWACLHPNLLYLNDGSGHFSEVGTATGSGLRMGGMGLGIGDYNADGLPDLLMSDTGSIVLLESSGSVGDPSWFDGALARGLELHPEEEQRWSGWGTEFVDMDNDGDLDGVMGYGHVPEEGVHDADNFYEQPDALYLQDDEGRFSEVAEAWGVDDLGLTRGLQTPDMNGDGFPDVLKRELDGPAVLYASNCGEGAWLDVFLAAPAPNTMAIGAVVEAVTGDRTRTRWVTLGATGLYSVARPEVHFGLGDEDRVDLLRVTWPDGEVSELRGLETRQRVWLTRTE